LRPVEITAIAPRFTPRLQSWS